MSEKTRCESGSDLEENVTEVHSRRSRSLGSPPTPVYEDRVPPSRVTKLARLVCQRPGVLAEVAPRRTVVEKRVFCPCVRRNLLSTPTNANPAALTPRGRRELGTATESEDSSLATWFSDTGAPPSQRGPRPDPLGA